MLHNPGQYIIQKEGPCWQAVRTFCCRLLGAGDGHATICVTPWMSLLVVVVCAWMGIARCPAEDFGTRVPPASVRKLSFPPPAGMSRADLYVARTAANPRAVLLLCPGFNGDGGNLVRQRAWQEFARTNNLVLCAISFASPGEEILTRRGYYQASQGSGDVLLRGLRLGLGRDLPVLVYGFSGGAHFTASLVNWKPERILSWCADSAAWWEEPSLHPAAIPPGIVACGDADAARYGASLTYFAQGRALGRPWTWVSLSGAEHVWSAPLDQFVRAYFAALLHGTPAPGTAFRANRAIASSAGDWRDVDTKQEISVGQASLQPALACWLPDHSVGILWSSLHQP